MKKFLPNLNLLRYIEILIFFVIGTFLYFLFQPLIQLISAEFKQKKDVAQVIVSGFSKEEYETMLKAVEEKVQKQQTVPASSIKNSFTVVNFEAEENIDAR